MQTPKAIVLAVECRGSEPWPSLGLAARQLAPVANKPILFHHLDALASVGVRETAVLTDGVTDTCIRGAVGDGSSWGMDVQYFSGDGDREDVLSSPAVAEFIDGAPVLLQHGDVLLREQLVNLWAQFSDHALDALVMHAGQWSAKRAQALSVDSYLFAPGVYPALREHAASPVVAGLGAALTGLRASGARIDERIVEACLPCRGGTSALLEANRKVLEEMADEPLASERVFDSEIQGRVSLHPSAEVRNSLIRGPVAIGAGARITDAYIGPYTSIAANVAIDSVEVEHSIVLEGAQISFLGVRLEGSLVGPGARIARTFRVPRALRLAVGGGTEIAMD
jgi:glucose-1-phosphate thymidylyltransferase